MSEQQDFKRRVSKIAVLSLIFAMMGFLFISPSKTVVARIIGEVSQEEPGLEIFSFSILMFSLSVLLGLFTLYKIRAKQSRVFDLNVLIVTLVVNLISFYQIIDYTYLHKLRDTRPVIPMTFNETSDKLQSTIITVRLDEPVRENSNVIWCSSFQLAWNELKNNIIKEPIKILDAQELADYLNQAPQTHNDIASQDVFTVAGYIKDGAVDEIHQGLSSYFPDKQLPDFGEVSDNDVIAYSCLQVNVPFKLPYRDIDQPLIFEDTLGNKTSVSAFGLSYQDKDKYQRIRNQIEILYQHVDEKKFDSPEFAVDLCRFSEPYQIILACVPFVNTLKDTINDVEQKISTYDGLRQLTTSQTLSVPNMFWNIQHHFTELEKKHFGNDKFTQYFINNAMQDIEFRLDRNGAELKSQTTIFVTLCASKCNYDFNRPFLVIIKKRDAEQPFFMMWVANAELLSPYEVESDR